MTQEIATQTTILAKAELDVQITTARAYPRQLDKFMKEVEEYATVNEDVAASCFYCLTRKDKQGKITEIRGPSIRFAEIAASCWENIHVGGRIIENDGKTITVEGVAWDLQKNVRYTSQIQKSIRTKEGYPYSQDMQDTVAKAAQAIAIRNAILKVIPRSLIDQIYASVMKKAIGDQKGFNEKRNQVFERFNKMGIETSKILTYLELGAITDITQDQLALLIGVGSAIKEGELNIDQAFNIQNDAIAGMDVNEKLKHTLSLKNEEIKNNG